MIDAVRLTQELVRFDTRNPPGGEAACAAFLARLLDDAGFAVTRHEFGAGRESLIARRGGSAVPVMFTGHIDTVPLGTVAWTHDPFGGDIVEGRLYGRGATDMKAGVAAMIAATVAEPGAVTLVLTGGEETGSHGAKALAAEGGLGPARCLIVGEPTDGKFLAGHKGALWLRACCHGTAAHGSTPHLGDNALYKAARGALALEQFQFNVARHPVMGAPTLNVGTMSAGQNINSVPDRAEFTVDIRTVPGMSHAGVIDGIGFTLGAETDLEALVDLPAVWSEPGEAEMAALANVYRATTGREAGVSAANYFTDASVLTPALGGVPTVICGPGDPAMAHKVDEYCAVERIGEAVEFYRGVLRALR